MTTAPTKNPRLFVLVTGMSGAGKTSVLKAFEDLAFEAIDNIPLSLLPNVIGSPAQGAQPPIAVGVDIRTRDFDARAFIKRLKSMRKRDDIRVKVLFVDCADQELLRRYTETRHVHPLAHDRPVLDGIAKERPLLAPLLDIADLRLDTTGDTPHAIKGFLAQNFSADQVNPGMAVFVTSFSYRFGIPRDADFVFDVRFLRNPHYDADLQAMTGRDLAVQNYIAHDSGFDQFFANLTTLLNPLMPLYAENGKAYLTLAVGCTGGKHRSVYVAEKLSEWFTNQNINSRLAHRDIPENSSLDKRDQS